MSAREQGNASVRVCLACGKVKGEHRGWDVSCDINSQEFDPGQLVRGEDGRVREVTDLPLDERIGRV